MRRLLIILVACVLVSVPIVGDAAPERRVALVIGNSNYMDAPLRNPVNDATDMASVLKKLGFSVTLKTDANQRAMKESIRSFGRQLTNGGVGLFYFAGHGIQYRGRNYLMPVHAEVNSEADVEYEAVDAGRVLAQMESAGNNLNIIILDACRNNPFARSFRSADKGLAKMDAPTGSILAYATAPGSVAADGHGRNGLYTEKLLKRMQTPGITVERMFKLVRKDVTRGSGKNQVPWESSSLMGDFYFITSKAKSHKPDRGISIEGRDAKKTPNAGDEAWNIVKTSTIVEDYIFFLEEYPESKFSGAAKLKIRQLRNKRKSSPKIAAVKTGDKGFIAFATGVVYDQNTGLEWYAGPDKKTNWNNAKAWVENLNVSGGNWRMPTKDELKTLYRKGSGKRNIKAPLITTGWRVWSVPRDSSTAWGFNFNNGKEFWKGRYGAYAIDRGFAVRTRQ